MRKMLICFYDGTSEIVEYDSSKLEQGVLTLWKSLDEETNLLIKGFNFEYIRSYEPVEEN